MMKIVKEEPRDIRHLEFSCGERIYFAPVTGKNPTKVIKKVVAPTVIRKVVTQKEIKKDVALKVVKMEVAPKEIKKEVEEPMEEAIPVVGATAEVFVKEEIVEGKHAFPAAKPNVFPVKKITQYKILDGRLSQSVSPSLSMDSQTSSDTTQKPLPKARKYELKPPEIREQPGYKKKRDLNNEAVRKSRNKAKEQQLAKERHFEVLFRDHRQMIEDCEALKQTNEALRRENCLLRKKIEKCTCRN